MADRNWDDRPMRSWMLRVRALPLRTRWVITIVAYALVVLGVVLAVRGLNSGSEGSAAGGGSQADARAEEEANREGRIAIAEDEAPHGAPLAAGVPEQVALERAVSADVHARIAHGGLTGPLQSVRCVAAASEHAGRRQLSCTVRSAGVGYPFVGVAERRTGQLTWCKLDPPAVAGAPLEVPVSPRCRA
jgi:hypothetical protein